MFRQEEIIFGGWQERTMESMQRRRFDQLVRQMPPLGAGRLDQLEPAAFARRIEQCWQDVERKPMRAQQIAHIWQRVLDSIEQQADCLSHEEHELVERALVLGGSAQIEDALELEAARALSLRLWANVGLVSGRPYIELEIPVLQPVARAFARAEHERIRGRLEGFRARLSGMLYRLGAIDDRQPQQLLLREVFDKQRSDEVHVHLARRYLWASFDCVDYSGGVMLVHSALADPQHLIASGRRRPVISLIPHEKMGLQLDILPEEIPLQRDLERAISGALRDGYHAPDVVRTLRFLCKQGAPLDALEDLLQEALIVYVSPFMRGALENMYYRLPKWIECAERHAAQQ